MDITQTVKELTEQVKSFNETNQKLVKEANDARAEVTRITKEYTDKVADLNTEIGKKDGTLKQIQDEVIELKAKMGRNVGGATAAVKSVQGLIDKAIEDNAEKIKAHTGSTVIMTEKYEKNTSWKFKDAGTITLGSNVTGASIVGIPTFSQDIATRGYDTIHYRDIFRTIDTATGTFAFYRENTPPGEGSFGFNDPGTAKNKVDKDLTLITVNCKYLNGYADVAKETLQDIPAFQSYINEALINDYLDRESLAFFLNLRNNSTGPVPSSGANIVEKGIYGIAGLRTRKYNPNAFICRPQVWAGIMVTKPNDYSIPNSVIITPSGAAAIVGLPLYVTASDGLSDSMLVLTDTRKAAILQVIGEGLKLELFQQHNPAVYNNVVTMRAEARVADVQFRLDATTIIPV
jgi:hypothetical protein